MAGIYNTTDGPLAVDRDGRMLAARDRREVTSITGEPLAGHIAAGRILTLDDVEAPTEEHTKPARKVGRTTSTTHEEA